MKFQVRIEFDATTLDDFDNLILLEDQIITKLGDIHTVDGHDFGEGSFTLFMHTNSPDSLISRLSDLNVLERAAQISVREFGTEIIKTVWPID